MKFEFQVIYVSPLSSVYCVLFTQPIKFIPQCFKNLKIAFMIYGHGQCTANTNCAVIIAKQCFSPCWCVGFYLAFYQKDERAQPVNRTKPWHFFSLVSFPPSPRRKKNVSHVSNDLSFYFRPFPYFLRLFLLYLNIYLFYFYVYTVHFYCIFITVPRNAYIYIYVYIYIYMTASVV